MGMPACFAARTTCSTFSGPPMFPGLMRTAATPASIAFSASDALKWMSAMIGIGESFTSIGSAAASSFFGTATRTTSQPAEASAAIWAVVATTSCVFVSVIDCTTTGAPPPTGTFPTVICTLLAIIGSVGARHASPSRLGEPADVVREPDEEQQQHDREPDDGDALVDLPLEVPAARALDEDEDDVPAVEREQRQEVEERERERDEPEHPQVVLRPLLDGVGGCLRDPDRARDVLPSLAGRELAERQHDLARDDPGHPERVADRLDRAESFALEAEPEPVAGVCLQRPRGTEPHLLAVPHDGERERAPVGVRDDVGNLVGVHLLPVDRDHAVACAKPHFLGGSRDSLRELRSDDGHGRRRLSAARHEEECEEDDREQDVRRRSGPDRNEPLPRRRLPVRVVADPVAKLRDALVDRGGSPGRERVALGNVLEVVERVRYSVEVAALELVL